MGIQINGNTDTISAIDGGLTVSGASLGSASASSLNISGIVTASSFSGPLTGNVTGNVAGNLTGAINSTGVSTITTLNATSIVGVTTAGITTAYIGSINNGPISGSKNRIINGDFEIWQRGTSVTYLDGSTNFYLADRWSGTAEYQNARHQRVSIADTASGMVTRYALRASSSTTAQAASGTRINLGQKIENVNMYDLRGKTITASFWVKFSAATVSSSTATAYGNWNAFFGFPTSVDASFATTTPITAVGRLQLANGALPTTWTKYSITAAVPSNAGNIDLRFQFDDLGNTASADTVWYDITQVQLEEGPVASVFERRSYGQELALCQRYCQRFRVFPTSSFDSFITYFGGTNALSSVKRLTTPMRATPIASFTNAAVQYYSYAGSWTNTTLLASIIDEQMYYIYCSSDGDGRSKLMRNGGAGLDPDPIVTFSAEL